VASLTSALVLHGYGCFVPDLTRFTAEPCEGARLWHSNLSRWSANTWRPGPWASW